TNEIRAHEVHRPNRRRRRVAPGNDVRLAALSSVPESAGVGAAAQRLQRALAQLEGLNQALASAREASSAAMKEVARLTDANARLRETVSELRREIATVRHCAYHDELTGLPNRSLLIDRMTQALSRASRQRRGVAVVLLDLDGFKAVND